MRGAVLRVTLADMLKTAKPFAICQRFLPSAHAEGRVRATQRCGDAWTRILLRCRLVSTSFEGIDVRATTVKAEQTVQEWGNGLAVRLTAAVARAAPLTRGMPITVEVVEGGIFLRIAGKPKLSLAQKLKSFDPATHGGEVMAVGQLGAEVF